MELQQAIRELTITDGNTDSVTDDFDRVSYTVKTILESGKEAAFSDQLGHFIARKEDEIEKMCNFHYQEFVQSVEQLLKVRLGTANLKSKIVNLNLEMQDAGEKIIEKKKEIIDHRKILLNIELAMETVQTCLFVLDVANKINSQIEKGKYYSSLRMLDDLQNTHLPRIVEYEFAKDMQHFIPTQRENIRQAVLKEIRLWLGTVNERTRAVGNAALGIAEKRELKRLENIVTHGHSISLDYIANDDLDVYDAAGEHIDFKPLFKCIHIHDVLGKRAVFMEQFEGHRGTQADLLFKSNFVLNSDDMKAFDTFLQDAVGFFIVEAVIMASTQNFRSRTNVEHLWHMASEKLNAIVVDGLADCQNPDAFFMIKQTLSSFVYILQGYGYAVDKLRTLILSLFDRHVELTKMSCCEQIIETIEEDDYTPVIVENQDEYKVIKSAIRFENTTPEKIKYPRILPFSKTIPDCCYLIKAYVNGFYRFSNGFDQHHNEMDDLLKKSLEGILINTVGATLSRKLVENDLGECIQILINADYFCIACSELEFIFSEKKGLNRGQVSLQASKFFVDFRPVAERRIISLVDSKIDAFLDHSVHYEWTSSVVQANPSPYLQDIANFVNSLLKSELTLLPAELRDRIYDSIIRHLASSFMTILVNKSGKKLSAQFLETFCKDVGFLEQFITVLGDSRIDYQFTELKQTIKFLLSDNYQNYIVSHVREGDFAAVNPTNLTVLLEKMRPEPSFIVGLSAAQKLKVKTIDAVLKYIREPKTAVRTHTFDD